MSEPGRRFDPTSWACLVLFGSCWGFTVPLTKIAVSTGHQPLGLIFWQFLISIVTLGAIIFIEKIPVSISGQTLKFYTVICLIGTLIPNSFSYLAAAHLPAGVMGIVIATVPMFALLVALSFRIEAFAAKRMLGILLGFAAILIIAAPETSLPEPEKAIFVLVALIAPFCYGCESNYLALRQPPDVDAIATLFMASVIGLIISAPLAWMSGHWVDLSVTWGNAEYALLLSGILHGLTYSGYIWLIGRAGPVFGSQIAYLVTITAVLFSAIMLGETYSAWIWLSLSIMIAGLALVRPRSDGNA